MQVPQDALKIHLPVVQRPLFPLHSLGLLTVVESNRIHAGLTALPLLQRTAAAYEVGRASDMPLGLRGQRLERYVALRTES